MTLNYHQPERSFRAQKVAAILCGACGAMMALGVRWFADNYPGQNLPALCVLVIGWLFCIIGAVWYLAVRRIES